MTDELKPCPFCGGEAHISASSDGYGVECWNRRCIDMQMDELPTEAEAIDAWNTRAERTCRDTGGYLMFRCSECGCSVEVDDFDSGEPNIFVDGIAATPRYCPNCGAKVVDA